MTSHELLVNTFNARGPFFLHVHGEKPTYRLPDYDLETLKNKFQPDPDKTRTENQLVFMQRHCDDAIVTIYCTPPQNDWEPIRDIWAFCAPLLKSDS